MLPALSGHKVRPPYAVEKLETRAPLSRFHSALLLLAHARLLASLKSWLKAPLPPPAVGLRTRAGIALAIGVGAGALVYVGLSDVPAFLAKDFTWPWRAARALLQGHDPYEVIRATGPFPFSSAFFYPLPAALVAVPFAPFAPAVAGALFFGLSSALLAFGLTRQALWPLLAFTSAPFMMTAANAQWSPVIMAAALLPGIQWLIVAKPNLGIAAFVFRPSFTGLIGGAGLILISFLILPPWVAGWRSALAEAPHHLPPLVRFGGPLLLLAALAWRSRQGRVLLAMSFVPQVLYFYDQLLLWLVPRSWRTMLILSITSWIGWFYWWQTRPPEGSGLQAAERAIMLTLYLPALVICLLEQGKAVRDRV